MRSPNSDPYPRGRLLRVETRFRTQDEAAVLHPCRRGRRAVGAFRRRLRDVARQDGGRCAVDSNVCHRHHQREHDMTPIHNRMPVILGPSDFDTWLDPAGTDLDALEALLVRLARTRSSSIHPLTRQQAREQLQGVAGTGPGVDDARVASQATQSIRVPTRCAAHRGRARGGGRARRRPSRRRR